MEFLSYLKEKINKSVLIMLFINPFSGRNDLAKKFDIEFYHKNFDYVFTSDIVDSQKYQMMFIESAGYSKLEYFQLNDIYDEFDLTFCGEGKDRSDDLIRIYDTLKNKNYKLNFTIVDGVERKGINGKRISYYEVMENTIKSKAILELMAFDSNMPSLRFQEAVVYNKHLITNNKSVALQSYYNPAWIHIVDSIDDIFDLDINNFSKPDFNYSDDHSSKKFLDKLVDLVEQ